MGDCLKTHIPPARPTTKTIAAGRPVKSIAGARSLPLRSERQSRTVRSEPSPVYPGNGELMQAFEATNFFFEQAANCLDLRKMSERS